MKEPDFTLGIEEEFLLVDRDSKALVEAPEGLMAECAAELDGQVSPEFLQCQIEIGTEVCADIAAAREDLKRLRATISRVAARHNLAPIAASCHPWADWKAQSHTEKERYEKLSRDLGSIADRMLICGMHVHVGLEEKALRIDLMNQAAYFLPHLLALSTSSPFWQGRDTLTDSWRISVFDNMPRTGLPPHFSGWDDYQRSVGVLTDLELIEDASKIWWDLRPSAGFPTLEMRIFDVQPRLEDALALAAFTQCLMRMLWRLRSRNQRWRRYEPFLVAENRWRAQRYGVREGLIDFGRGAIVPVPELTDEVIEMLDQDAGILRCSEELERCATIARRGTSADRQRAVRDAARDEGADAHAAMEAVVAHLIEEYHADL